MGGPVTTQRGNRGRRGDGKRCTGTCHALRSVHPARTRAPHPRMAVTPETAPTQPPDGGPAVDLEATTIDLTDHARAAEEAGFREVVDQAPVGLLVADLDGVVGYVNATAGRARRRGARRPLGRADLAPDPPRRPPAAGRGRRAAPPLGPGRDHRLPPAGPGPRVPPGAHPAVPAARAGSAGRSGIVASISDHSDVEHRATHDELTGLPKRTLLGAHLGDALARAERDGTTLAVLLVGLDRLQIVTDALGHGAGDRVIRQAARRLAVAVGSGDLVGRFSEDRFVVVKEGVGERRCRRPPGGPARPRRRAGRAPSTATRRSSAPRSASPCRRRGRAPSTSWCATPTSPWPGPAAAPAPRFEVFDPEMRSWVEARRALEIALRRSVEHEELELAYQPIVSVADRALRGFEALARWNHPELRARLAGGVHPRRRGVRAHRAARRRPSSRGPAASSPTGSASTPRSSCR